MSAKYLKFSRISLLVFVSTLFAFFVVGFPVLVRAEASILLSPPAGTYKVGELFSVLVNVNTGGEPINVATGQISFDNLRLEVDSVGFSRSIFTLWTAEPTFSNPAGSISFSGGVPSPGFTGPSGSILRITFRAKAGGQAPVTIMSGSVLANDGAGTNIADALRGALFTIVGIAPPSPPPPPKIPEKTEELPDITKQAYEAPVITEWPRQVESGSTFTISGLAQPLNKVLFTVQKGEDEPTRHEVFSGPDGRFQFTPPRPVQAGFYRVWARNITLDGVASERSDSVIIEAIQPTFFRVGELALNYLSIVVTLLSLILLLVLILGFIWYLIRRYQSRQGVEISEAELEVHNSFSKLREGLTRYISYLAGAKTAAGLHRREEKTRVELTEELEVMEANLEKEIRDIKKPPKKRTIEE